MGEAFMRLGRDHKLSQDRVGTAEQDGRSMSGLDHWLKLEDEVPNTVRFMQDHGVEMIHHDEQNAAVDFEDQHFVFLSSGGKEIIDFYFDYIARYENADVFWGHEAISLTLDDEGRVGGIVVRKPDGLLRTLTADTVVLACGGFGGEPGDAHAVHRRGCGRLSGYRLRHPL